MINVENHVTLILFDTCHLALEFFVVGMYPLSLSLSLSPTTWRLFDPTVLMGN
jgi:hypothetical protein